MPKYRQSSCFLCATDICSGAEGPILLVLCILPMEPSAREKTFYLTNDHLVKSNRSNNQTCPHMLRRSGNASDRRA